MANFPCTVADCDRVGVKAFKREEHRRNHLRKIYGTGMHLSLRLADERRMLLLKGYGRW